MKRVPSGRQILITAIMVLACVPTCLVSYLTVKHLSRDVQATRDSMEQYPDQEAIERILEVGDNIAGALAKYKAANGWYPADLGMLVPDWIESIDSPAVGGAWAYWCDEDGQFYQLRFGMGADLYPCWARDSTSSEWVRDS